MQTTYTPLNIILVIISVQFVFSWKAKPFAYDYFLSLHFSQGKCQYVRSAFSHDEKVKCIILPCDIPITFPRDKKVAFFFQNVARCVKICVCFSILNSGKILAKVKSHFDIYWNLDSETLMQVLEALKVGYSTWYLISWQCLENAKKEFNKLKLFGVSVYVMRIS